MHRSRCARSFARAFAALVVLVPLLGAVTPAHAAAAPRRVTAWLPYWDQARGYQSFLAHADLYSVLSPFWYSMTPTGSVQGYPGAADKSIVAGARANGVRVLPTITNDFDPVRVRTMLSTKIRQSRHVSALVNLVKSNGYDGLDVDYENLYAGDRSRYSSFLSKLATSLHSAGKTLSVAVHPKTSEPGSWSGPQAQDYKAIGAVADTVRVMAYDYSWSTSAAGPVAPLTWVDEVARFAASQIAPSKIELGMPLYGYDWVGTVGTGVTYDEAIARRTAYSATSQWSSTAQSSWFSYVADGVAHTVWYADASSVAAALPIVDRYGLAGAAFWRLGGEDAATWAAVRSHWSTA